MKEGDYFENALNDQIIELIGTTAVHQNHET